MLSHEGYEYLEEKLMAKKTKKKSSTDPINIIRFLLCKKKINTNYNFADKKKKDNTRETERQWQSQHIYRDSLNHSKYFKHTNGTTKTSKTLYGKG